MQYLIQCTAFSGVLLAICFFKFDKKTFWLGLFFLGSTLEIISQVARQDIPQLYFIFSGNTLLYLPALYLQMVVLKYNKVQAVFSRNLLLFLPWLSSSFYRVYWLSQPYTFQSQHLNSSGFWEAQFFSHLMAVLFFVFIMKQYFKNTSLPIYLWLRRFAILFLILHIALLLHDLSLLYLPLPSLVYFLCVYLLFLNLWVGLSAFQIQTSFMYLLFDEQVIYSKTEEFLVTSKAYRDSRLKLSTVAQEVGITPEKLSRIIRKAGNSNFHSYINKFRLEEFKTLLASDTSNALSLEGLARESGFGSKTTFFKFFKEEEGVTPKEYQKQLQR